MFWQELGTEEDLWQVNSVGMVSDTRMSLMLRVMDRRDSIGYLRC